MSTTTQKSKWDKEKIKTAKGKTYVAIVLDQSSSMSSSKEQAVAGYNDTVEELKELNKDPDIEMIVSLVTFDSYVQEHLWNVPAEQLKKSTYESFKPDRCTALRDGLGYTIDKLLETKLAKDDAVLVILISDGGENSSKHVSADVLKSKIEECQAGDQWTFTYMGCSEENLKAVAASTGMLAANMAVWNNHDNVGTARAMAQNKSKLRSYAGARAKGATKSELFHSEVACCSADYTKDDGHGVDADMSFNAMSASEAKLEVTGGTDVFGGSQAVSNWTLKNMKNSAGKDIQG